MSLQGFFVLYQAIFRTVPIGLESFRKLVGLFISSIDLSYPIHKEWCVIYTSQASSKSFQFCIEGFCRCVGTSVVKEV